MCVCVHNKHWTVALKFVMSECSVIATLALSKDTLYPERTFAAKKTKTSIWSVTIVTFTHAIHTILEQNDHNVCTCDLSY